MNAKSPEQVNELLIDALTRGDIDSAVGLYEADAKFVTAEGVVTGKTAIRNVLEGFISVAPTFRLRPKATVRNGEIALTGNNWSLTGTDQDGQSVEMSGSSYEVVRRGSDGNWRFVIDNPDAK